MWWDLYRAGPPRRGEAAEAEVGGGAATLDTLDAWSRWGWGPTAGLHCASFEPQRGGGAQLLMIAQSAPEGAGLAKRYFWHRDYKHGFW